jgi:hypothetical protein
VNRREILEETINKNRELYTKMEKKLIDRQEADSRVNALGKILKGIQLHMADEMFTEQKLASPTIAAQKLLEQK